MESYQRTLVAAQGYCELSMYEDALAELDSIPEPWQSEAVVVEMRLVTLMQAERWEDALLQGARLCELRPDANSGFIHTAFALHELGRTAQALEWLQRGPSSLEKEANYFYNLACYECVLGRREAAQQHLSRAFALDGKYRQFAKNDPDLQALRVPQAGSGSV